MFAIACASAALLQLAADPAALWPRQRHIDIQFAGFKRPIVQVRRIAYAADGAVGAQLGIQHLPRNRPPLTALPEAGILDRVFEVEQHPRRCAGVALVNQHGAAPQQVAVALQHQVERSIQQWVARAEKRSQWLALGREQ